MRAKIFKAVRFEDRSGRAAAFSARDMKPHEEA